jgi:UPF0755 protein
MTEKRSRSRLPLILVIPVLVVFCLALLIGAGAALEVPQQAEATFGPATPTLGYIKRIYLSTLLLWQQEDLTRAVNPDGGNTPFHVSLGESPISVSNRLWSQDLITNPNAFRDYLVYAGIDTRIQAGNYNLNPAMTPIEIAQTLQDSTSSEVLFPVLAGWRIEEIAASLPTSGLRIKPERFISVAQNKSAEGSLFPGEYTLHRDTSAEILVLSLMEAFQEAITLEIKQGFDQQGLSRDQALILASIVERESIIDEEMPLIASVFLNRLAIDMKLDADPTVQYALGYNNTQGTWWTNPLSNTDLQIDSPFNTYLYAGLPPTPICNPGSNALRAVAFPAQTPYYYFRAACDGSGRHSFAETFEEHQDNACP